MKSKIDRLLCEGKENEAIPLIEAVWAKDKAKQEAQTEKQIGVQIANLNRKLEAFEKSKHRAE